MTAQYLVELFHADHNERVAELEHAIMAELTTLGVHRSVQVTLTSSPGADSPTVGVYFGSSLAAVDQALHERLRVAVRTGKVVIPVLDSLRDFPAVVPQVLSRLNGWAWAGPSPGLRLARRLLEELGVEDRRRRVFISHKRDDGAAAAVQLHDVLSHRGFEPFIDRFGVEPGDDVQDRVADALEDCAFLLLLETPLAHTSDWVWDEVEYAQSHQMGLHIVTWPGRITELPGTNRWPRQLLQARDLRREKGYEVFTEDALEAILEEVESIHANALARRRRYLLRNVQDAASAAGLACTPLQGWRLQVEARDGTSVVQVSARLPTVEDLYELDTAKMSIGNPPGVLVHSARMLRASRRALLAWAGHTRDLTLVPENAIGGYWY